MPNPYAIVQPRYRRMSRTSPRKRLGKLAGCVGEPLDQPDRLGIPIPLVGLPYREASHQSHRRQWRNDCGPPETTCRRSDRQSFRRYQILFSMQMRFGMLTKIRCGWRVLKTLPRRPWEGKILRLRSRSRWLSPGLAEGRLLRLQSLFSPTWDNNHCSVEAGLVSIERKF